MNHLSPLERGSRENLIFLQRNSTVEGLSQCHRDAVVIRMGAADWRETDDPTWFTDYVK
jgi:hypothetical protein